MPKTYLTGIVMFILSAITMILELIGSRILAPFVGTSVVVWTNLIGLSLGGLSLGYYLGGRQADKGTNFTVLARMIFAASLFTTLTLLTHKVCLGFLVKIIPHILPSSFVAALVLFMPINVCLGMTFPYLMKLGIQKTKNVGKTIGGLYALSAMGNIMGTFAAGFLLIPHFGSYKILLSLDIVLLVMGFLTYSQKIKLRHLMRIFTVITVLLFIARYPSMSDKNVLKELDTQYNRITVFLFKNDKEQMKIMKVNNDYSSAAYLNRKELAFDYTKFFRISGFFNRDIKRGLLIGGGAYSYAMQFLTDFPGATLDVVELDPKVTELAIKYFGLRSNNRLSIFHEDGRTFINQKKGSYDVVFIDAFDNNAVPFQLTTQEAVKKIYNLLSDNGIVILNLISSLEGSKSDFLHAETSTYRSVFPQVHLFPVHSKNDLALTQTIILTALKTNTEVDFNNPPDFYKNYLDHRYTNKFLRKSILLTDDYAPVEFFISKTY